jgi:hypothetical protein
MCNPLPGPSSRHDRSAEKPAPWRVVRVSEVGRHGHNGGLRRESRGTASSGATPAESAPAQTVTTLDRLHASIPLTGFGASDCACESHLYFRVSLPWRAEFSILLL